VLQKIRTISVREPAAFRAPSLRVIIVLSRFRCSAIVVLVAWELIDKSRFVGCTNSGSGFFYGHDWDPGLNGTL